MTPSTLMAILAHPDDESFPIGGTLAKYARSGAYVTLVTATNGQHGIPGLTPVQAGEVRIGELYAAAATLGIAEVRRLGSVDHRFRKVKNEQRFAVS